MNQTEITIDGVTFFVEYYEHREEMIDHVTTRGGLSLNHDYDLVTFEIISVKDIDGEPCPYDEKAIINELQKLN